MTAGVSLWQLLPESAGRGPQGQLTLAGCDANELAEQHGTPLYIYDGLTIEKQAGQLRDGMSLGSPAGFEIAYAAKAYFSLRFARHIAALDLSVDAVSLGEMVVARHAGFAPEKVHLHGNNKSPEEILYALEWGVRSIVVDSLDELRFLEALAGQRGKTARILLRIAPGITVDTHAAVQTGHAATKFGIPLADGQAVEAIRLALASRRLTLAGLHTHLGSNIFQAEPYARAAGILAELAEEAGFIPQEMNLGGGWGVPYLPDQGENPPESWVAAVCGSVIQEFKRRMWDLPVIGIEPGRLLAARAGVALYRVGAIKTTGDGTRVVAVDGGMADNPRPALYGSRYSVLLASRAEDPPLQKASIAGRFCESGDVLIHDAWIPEVKRGDLLAVPVAGAYHLSMASNYNLAPRPAVLWLKEGEVEVLQNRERPETQAYWTG